MHPIVRVFVSSTWLDLQPEREAVEKALQRMCQAKLNGMEYFGSRDENTRDVSLCEVDRCDVYVGIIGGRYGSGITEEEYRKASEKKLPRFIYFKDEQTISPDGRDAEEEKQTRLATWKTELRESHTLGTGPFTSPDDLAARVTVDLSNWYLDRYAAKMILEGVDSLPYGYVGRIENFLNEYLGTTKFPVPFGGREKDLKILDAWLEDKDAPPYLMMAAPAGRGKSALLVRWTRQLLARRDIALVFVPISIRFRTNLSAVTFAALAARLAQLHGETIRDTLSTSAETWRGFVTGYLRRPLPDGETLVVVLDGLDEAADWEPEQDLFPFPPPDHVRIIVSARYRAGDTDSEDWLRRLGWGHKGLARSIDLSTLTKEGVARVLESMGFPLAQLGAKVDVVAELHRLSEGDPLLVTLYVRDLWSRKDTVPSLRPDDLRKLKPGLKGYFDRWLDDQRTLWGKESPLKEQNVQILLNVLASSLGPLDKGDVLHLTTLSSWDLEEALRPLNRFVIGDGKINGYTFSHPRLGYYFKDKLSEREQHDWEEKFLAWGRDTVQALELALLTPVKTPPYIVQYYGIHLEQTHASAETMLTLVCQGWHRAWEVQEGSFSGFLTDVERAWKAAERENGKFIAKGDMAPHIGGEIRCALVRASINSLAANVSVELLLQLFKHQKWTLQQVLVYARQIPDTGRRAEALLRLASELELPDDLRDQILVETLAAVREPNRTHLRIKILSALASYQPNAVLTAVRELPDSWQRVEVLCALAPYQPNAVLTAIRKLPDSRQRVEVLCALASYQPEEVWAAAQELSDRWDCARVLIALLAPEVPRAGESILEQAFAIARELPDSSLRAKVLIALVPYQPEAVWAAAQELSDRWDRARVLIALLAPEVPRAGESILEQAFASARELPDTRDRAKVLIALVPHQPEAVWAAARELLESRYLLEVLIALLPRVAPHAREPLLEEALVAAWDLNESQNRACVLTAMTSQPPDSVLAARLEFDKNRYREQVLEALVSHRPEAVLAAVQKLSDSEQLLEVLIALLPYMAPRARAPVVMRTFVASLDAALALLKKRYRAQVLEVLVSHRPEAVLAAVQARPEMEHLVEVLIALAPHQPEAVWAVAQELSDTWDRARVLIALIPHQPEAVLAATQKLPDTEHRIEVLRALARYQPEPVLAAARRLMDSKQRAQVLIALAPHQPEAVWAAAQKLSDRRQRVEVLCALAPHRPEAVLAAAQKLLDEWDRAQVLIALLPHLEAQTHELILKQALVAAQKLPDKRQRVEVLCALAPHRPEAVWAAAQKLLDEWDRARVLIACLAPEAPRAGESILEQAFASARELQDTWLGASVLIALVPYQPEDVWAAAQKLPDRRQRVEVLCALAPHRPEAVWAAIPGLPNADRAQVLEVLAPYQPEAVWAAAQELPDRRQRVEVLCALAPHRPEAVWAAIPGLPNADRAQVLEVLAPYQPEAVWAAAQKLLDKWDRARVLIACLAPEAPRAGESMLEQALASVQEFPDSWRRAQVLIALAPYRPEGVWAAAQELPDSEHRTKVLIALAPYLPELSSNHLCQLWQLMLRQCSKSTRKELMRDLSSLISVIEKLGKPRALESMLQAVQDVTTWWP